MADMKSWLYQYCTRSLPQGHLKTKQFSHVMARVIHARNQTSVTQTARCGLFTWTLATLSAQYMTKGCVWGRPRGDEQQEKAKQLYPVHSHLGYATLILKKVPHVQWRKIQTIGTTKAQLLSATLMYSCIDSKMLFYVYIYKRLFIHKSVHKGLYI